MDAPDTVRIILIIVFVLLFGSLLFGMAELVFVTIPEQQDLKTDFCRDYFYASDDYFCPTNIGVKEFVCNYNLKECYWLTDSRGSDEQ